MHAARSCTVDIRDGERGSLVLFLGDMCDDGAGEVELMEGHDDIGE